jgi:lipopolysaccharide export system protein LptA
MVVEHADHLDGYNQPNSVSTFTGNVLTTQGTLKLTGDIVKIYTDADTQVSRVVALPAKGKRAHIEQIDDSGNLMTGDANELDYDNVNGIATLIGNAVVHQQCRGDAHGDKLVYNTQTSQITGESGGSSIVHMVFLPKNKAGAPPVQPGCPTPAATAPAKPAAAPAAKPDAKPDAAKPAASPAKGD